jgi:hypothetical protein
MTNPDFKLALIKLKQDYPVLFPVISAQWCYESNYGSSRLARNAKNYAGLKFRQDISCHLSKDVWTRVGKYIHKDTKGDTDPYVMCHKASDFVEVYMAFLSRSPYCAASYQGIIDPHLFGDLRQPTTFLAHIADCGFCAWIPRFEGTQQEIYTEYVYRVLKVLHSKKYREVVANV